MISDMRVFLSSTFRDLAEERRIFAERVFPAVRHNLRGTGISFVDVDLRWGITEEESREGSTVALCIAEIEACSPDVVVLIGDAYGWRPEVSAALVDLHPWMRQCHGRSITEVEIACALANRRPGDPPLLCYTRDERPGISRDPQVARLLASLQREAGIRIQRWSGLEEIETLATRDLIARARTRNPATSKDRHPALAGYERALEESPNPGRWPPLFDLTEITRPMAPVVLLSGGPGSGRTSAALGLVERLAERGWSVPTRNGAESGVCGPRVIPLFEDRNAPWKTSLERIIVAMSELVSGVGPGEDRVGLHVALAADELATVLDGAGQILFVIDDLDRSSDPLLRPKVRHLASSLPPNARIVATCARGGALDAIASTSEDERRQIHRVQLRSLSAEQISQTVALTLSAHGKRLDRDTANTFFGARLAGNPGCLAAMVEELRTRSTFGTLGSDVQLVADLDSAVALFAHLLDARMRSLPPEVASIFTRSLAALAVSPLGLPEEDLRILVADDSPLPARNWSIVASLLWPFVAAAGTGLRLRNADVEKAVLAGVVVSKLEDCSRRIADHFLSRVHSATALAHAGYQAARMLDSASAEQILATDHRIEILAAHDWPCMRAVIATALGDRDPADWDILRRRRSPAALAFLALALEQTGRARRSTRHQDLAWLAAVQVDRDGPDLLQMFEGTIFAAGVDCGAARREAREERLESRSRLHAAMAREGWNGLAVTVHGAGMSVALTRGHGVDPDFPAGGDLRVLYETKDGVALPYTLKYSEPHPVVRAVKIQLKKAEIGLREATDGLLAANGEAGAWARVATYKRGYHAVADLAVAVALLLGDLHWVTEILTDRLTIDYEPGHLLEVIRCARRFSGAAAALGDVELFSRCLAIRAQAARQSGLRGVMEAALAELDRFESGAKLTGDLAARQVLRGLRDALADELIRAQLGFQDPSREDWTPPSLTMAARMLIRAEAGDQIPRNLLRRVFEIDVDAIVGS